MKRLFALAAIAVTLALAPPSLGESVAELEKKLLRDGDFRVRAQAALALGSSGAKEAVAPLCRGLDDASDTVRAAAAAALGKLSLGGKPCLEKRLEKEQERNVQSMIKKAIKLLDEAALGPALTGESRYYIAVAATKGSGGYDEKLRAALLAAAARHDGYVLAPAGETVEQAQKRLRKFPKVVPYAFAPTLSVDRNGSRVEVRLEIAIASYPDGEPLGSIGRSAVREGEDAERQLIAEVSKGAMDEFDKLAAQVD